MGLLRVFFLAVGLTLLAMGGSQLRSARSRNTEEWSPELEPNQERRLRRVSMIIGIAESAMGAIAVLAAFTAKPA